MRKLETHDWWPELVSLKDELSLRQLAERFGASPGAISSALKRNGITRKPAPPGPRKRRGRKSGRSKIDAFASEVGTVPDRIIAEKAGVSVSAVGAWRRRRGISASTGSADSAAPSSPQPVADTAIPSVEPSSVPEESVTAAPLPAPSGSRVQAWRVVIGGTVGVVLASSVVEAARVASAGGQPSSLELVGSVLHDVS